MLLTDKGKLLLNFFCHNVEEVIAINAMNEGIMPSVGNIFPISRPKTKAAQRKPKITPTHC